MYAVRVSLVVPTVVFLNVMQCVSKPAEISQRMSTNETDSSAEADATEFVSY